MSFINMAQCEEDPSAQVKATEAKLEAIIHLDGEPAPSEASRRFAWALMIESPAGEVAGHAMYYYICSAWRAEPGIFLEELFVLPQHRRSGYGRLLIQALAAEARGSGCTMLEWNCYRDNEKALRFYGSLGATRMDNWVTLRLLDGDLERLAEEAGGGDQMKKGNERVTDVSP